MPPKKHNARKAKEIQLPELVQIWECREQQTMMSPKEWATVISILQKLLPEYAVRDFTNLENDHCYIVEVLLHKGQIPFLDDGLELIAQVGGSARVLQTFVSRIAPYYYGYVWEMSANGADGNLRFAYPKRAQLSQREKQITVLIERLLKSFGYQSLPPRTAATVVPDIETECLNKGEVTIFHLLFSELFSVR